MSTYELEILPFPSAFSCIRMAFLWCLSISGYPWSNRQGERNSHRLLLVLPAIFHCDYLFDKISLVFVVRDAARSAIILIKYRICIVYFLKSHQPSHQPGLGCSMCNVQIVDIKLNLNIAIGHSQHSGIENKWTLIQFHLSNSMKSI